MHARASRSCGAVPTSHTLRRDSVQTPSRPTASHHLGCAHDTLLPTVYAASIDIFDVRPRPHARTIRPAIPRYRCAARIRSVRFYSDFCFRIGRQLRAPRLEGKTHEEQGFTPLLWHGEPHSHPIQTHLDYMRPTPRDLKPNDYSTCAHTGGAHDACSCVSSRHSQHRRPRPHARTMRPAICDIGGQPGAPLRSPSSRQEL